MSVVPIVVSGSLGVRWFPCWIAWSGWWCGRVLLWRTGMERYPTRRIAGWKAVPRRLVYLIERGILELPTGSFVRIGHMGDSHESTRLHGKDRARSAAQRSAIHGQAVNDSIASAYRSVVQGASKDRWVQMLTTADGGHGGGRRCRG